jgi:hypothetical protein
MVALKGNPDQLRKQARYLLSIACLVKDAAKHDELQRKAQELLAKVDGPHWARALTVNRSIRHERKRDTVFLRTGKSGYRL